VTRGAGPALEAGVSRRAVTTKQTLRHWQLLSQESRTLDQSTDWSREILMYPEIGSYDAKTKLPELLREVQAGHRYTITLRGKPVAELVPVQRAGQGEIREAVAAMRAVRRIKGVVPADLDRWVAAGRR